MQLPQLNLPPHCTGKKLLIAVSGGIDSMVLCDRCKAEKMDFAIAHCNFKLRGEESDADEIFVSDYAKKKYIVVYSKSFDTILYSREHRVSTQVAARQLRYAWFEEVMQQHGYDYLLTAHHADDNAETVLMNFCKGTGIRGLRGILAFSGKIIRPFLETPRTILAEYARENNVSFREDSSNASTKYTRNYFRKEIIPAIEKVFPEFRANMQANIDRMMDVETLYIEQLQRLKKDLVEQRGDEFFIPVLKLQKTPGLSTVIHEIFAAYGFGPQQAVEVEKILTSTSGRYVDSKTHRVLKDRKWLIVAPLQSTEVSVQLIKEDTKQLSFANGELVFKPLPEPQPISGSANEIQVDASQLVYPLYLRKWKAGDYFYPLGMPKKKKISRVLTDLKLPLTAKEKVYVIESGKKILWVVGYRIDDRFKIKPATKQALKITYTTK